MVEILEKGIRNPEPYRAIYESYQHAFPDVKHHYPQSLEHILGHFLSSRAYYVSGEHKREAFILQNNFPRLIIYGMIGYAIKNTVIAELIANPQKAIKDSTLLGACVLSAICIKRASMYHEFAHFIHNLNNKTPIRSELFIEEYISDVAARHAMQNGTPLDRAISAIFPVLRITP